MTDPAPTIGEMLVETMNPRTGRTWGPGVFFDKLGIDPETPAANVIALQPGQAVVEWRNPRPGENYYSISPELSRPAAVIIRHAEGNPA